MPFLTPFEHCSSLSFSAHFPITEKWSCHAFFPPPHAWCTPPPALTSRIWLPPRTALVGPVPLPQGPTHGSGLQEEDWCGWGVPFKNTVFVATACVCVWYICMHQHHPCTTLISRAAQLFHLSQDRSKEESLDGIEFDHGIIMCRIFFSELPDVACCLCPWFDSVAFWIFTDSVGKK